MAEVLTTLLEAEQRSSGKDETFVSTPFFPILQNYTKDGERKIIVTFNKGYVISCTEQKEDNGSGVKSCAAHKAPKNINDIWILEKDEDVSFVLRFKTYKGSSSIDGETIEIITTQEEIDNENVININEDGEEGLVSTHLVPMCRIKSGKIASLVLRENIHWQQPAFANATREEGEHSILVAPDVNGTSAAIHGANPVTFKNLAAGSGITLESTDDKITIGTDSSLIVRDRKDFAARFSGGKFYIRSGRIISQPRRGEGNAFERVIGVVGQIRTQPYFTVPETEISEELGKYVYLYYELVREAGIKDTFPDIYTSSQNYRAAKTGNIGIAPVEVDIEEVPPKIVQSNNAKKSVRDWYRWFPIGEFEDGKFIQKHDGPVVIPQYWFFKLWNTNESGNVGGNALVETFEITD